MKNLISDWVAYLFISFIWLLSNIYGIDNLKKIAKKIDEKVKE